MTMLSFRLSQAEAADLERVADALGMDRSELLRDALHRHLTALRAHEDAANWRRNPPTDDELSLVAIADWGPAEDWTDWVDATR